MTQYIEVEGWSDFQHYKRREGKAVTSPHWIKTYTNLLQKYEYRLLTGYQRGILHGLWILYATSGCQLALDTSTLSSQLGLKVTTDQLQALSDAGFIHFSSREALAQNRKEEKIKSFSNLETPEPLKTLHRAHLREVS